MEKAESAIKKAEEMEIDMDSTEVEQMKCKINIETGNVVTAKSLMNDLEAGKNVIAYMNNRAVTLARNGRFEDGISLYKKTIESIPTS